MPLVITSNDDSPTSSPLMLRGEVGEAIEVLAPKRENSYNSPQHQQQHDEHDEHDDHHHHLRTQSVPLYLPSLEFTEDSTEASLSPHTPPFPALLVFQQSHHQDQEEEEGVEACCTPGGGLYNNTPNNNNNNKEEEEVEKEQSLILYPSSLASTFSQSSGSPHSSPASSPKPHSRSRSRSQKTTPPPQRQQQSQQSQHKRPIPPLSLKKKKRPVSNKKSILSHAFSPNLSNSRSLNDLTSLIIKKDTSKQKESNNRGTSNSKGKGNNNNNNNSIMDTSNKNNKNSNNGNGNNDDTTTSTTTTTTPTQALLYPVVQDLTEVEYGGCCPCDDVVNGTNFSLRDLSLVTTTPLDVHKNHNNNASKKQEIADQEQDQEDEDDELPDLSSPTSSMDTGSNPFLSLSRSHSSGGGGGNGGGGPSSSTSGARKIMQHLRNKSSSSSTASFIFKSSNKNKQHNRTLSNATSSSSAITTTTTAATFQHQPTRTADDSSSKDFMDEEENIVTDLEGSGMLMMQHTSTSQQDQQQQEPKFEQDYVLTRQIFECNFSAVWECVHRASGVRYCVKICDFAQLSPDQQEASLQEVQALEWVQSQSHPSIVKLYQVYGNTNNNNNNTSSPAGTTRTSSRKPQKIYIVMELATGGNLHSRVIQEGFFEEERVKKIAVALLQGILHLQEAYCLCHVDFQPTNILLHRGNDDSKSNNRSKNQNDDRPVIADFGSACRINGVVSRLPDEGHMRYAAPEILNHQTCNAVTDMWSLGVVLYFCLFGELPPLYDNGSGGDRNLNNNNAAATRSRTGTWDFTFPTTPASAATTSFSMSPPSPLARNSTYPPSPARSPQRAQSSLVDERLGQLPLSRSRSSSPPQSSQQQQQPLVSRQAKQLISACLHSDPTVRLTPEEALAHPWLADIVEEANNKKNGKNKNDSSRRGFRGRGWLGRAVSKRFSSLLFSNNNEHNNRNIDSSNKKDMDLTAATTTESSGVGLTPYTDDDIAYHQQYHHQRKHQRQHHRRYYSDHGFDHRGGDSMNENNYQYDRRNDDDDVDDHRRPNRFSPPPPPSSPPRSPRVGYRRHFRPSMGR